MRPQLLAALRMLLVMTVVTGLAYPLVVTGIGQALFGNEADGSLIERGGEVVGSSLIRQEFTGGEFFQPRPSAAGAGAAGALADVTDGAGESTGEQEPADLSDYSTGIANSSASNLGPTNPEFLDAIDQRVAAYRELNGLADDAQVPVDAVTASGSGLDPHISVRNAELQASRVARARSLDKGEVLDLVAEHTASRSLGFLGEEGVNVLELNLSLDYLG